MVADPPDPTAAAPPWRTIDLPGRGPLRIRDSGQPADADGGAPPLVLFHGWTASSDLNWCRTYPYLTDNHRVMAWDQRGHGPGGIRSRRRFRLEDCADDAAALLRATGVGPVVAVGYSMGGAVAQLLWRRHPHLVAGLVLCASAMRFRQTAAEYRDFALIGLASWPSALFPDACWRLAERVAEMRSGTDPLVDPAFDRWAARQVRSGDLHQVLRAGAAIGRFDSSSWIGSVDVPSAVLVGVDDSVVATARQRQLAVAVPGAHVVEFGGDHAAPVTRPDSFAERLLAGIGAVSS